MDHLFEEQRRVDGVASCADHLRNVARPAQRSLPWSATNADTCTITPDIGPVDTSGSLAVLPAEKTTYNIIATGTLWYGGEAVDARLDTLENLPLMLKGISMWLNTAIT